MCPHSGMLPNLATSCSYSPERHSERHQRGWGDTIRGRRTPDLCVSHTNLRHASDLFNGHIKPEEVEGFASDRGQVGHPHSFLINKGQVTVHPHLPLGLRSQLIQASYLLTGCGGRIGLLFCMRKEPQSEMSQPFKQNVTCCQELFLYL